MQRIEVKTKAAAEKAIKAGKPVSIVAGRFALAIAGLTGVDIHIAATAQIELTLTDIVGTVAQADMWSSRVEARGSSSVVARGSSRVEAWESSSVEARGSSRVVAWGSSSVVAWESSRVEAWESSRVVAWGSSSVVAWESSRVEAWESSRVVAWGSSSVVARGYSFLDVRKGDVSAKASATVCVNLWNGATCDGGRQQTVSLTTPQDWCEYYGARIDGEYAIVYKAVGEGYRSEWGAIYTPGTTPSDPKWDGRKRECSAGGGLNFSPTPRHTHRFVNQPKHYLECRIRLEDMVCHWDGQYPEKICAREVAVPLIEVDVDGNPVPATETVA